MRKLRNDQSGFSAVEGLLFLVIIAIIGFTSWYVWHANQNTNKNLASTSTTTPAAIKKTASKTTVAAAPTLETYNNTAYKFNFQYPSTWKLTQDLQDAGRGEPEGNIVVTSPAGTVITFNANLGGKGGDCGDVQANGQRTAGSCTTVENLKLEPFASGLSGRTFYYYEAKITPPTKQGGSVTYQVGIADNEFSTPVLGSYLTDIPTHVITTATGDLNISYSGKDDATNTSATFLNSTEVQEVASVLKTLQLN